jgi:hypothetical protein
MQQGVPRVSLFVDFVPNSRLDIEQAGDFGIAGIGDNDIHLTLYGF